MKEDRDQLRDKYTSLHSQIQSLLGNQTQMITNITTLRSQTEAANSRVRGGNGLNMMKSPMF